MANKNRTFRINETTGVLIGEAFKLLATKMDTDVKTEIKGMALNEVVVKIAQFEQQQKDMRMLVEKLGLNEATTVTAVDATVVTDATAVTIVEV